MQSAREDLVFLIFATSRFAEMERLRSLKLAMTRIQKLVMGVPVYAESKLATYVQRLDSSANLILVRTSLQAMKMEEIVMMEILTTTTGV